MALLLPVFKTAPDTRCENAGELRDAGRAQRERPNANKREEGMSNIKEEEEELRKPSQSVNPFQYFQSHAGKKSSMNMVIAHLGERSSLCNRRADGEKGKRGIPYKGSSALIREEKLCK